MQEAQENALRKKMLQHQMEMHALAKKKAEQEQADAEAMRNFNFGQFYQSPQSQAIGAMGPTPEAAAAIPGLAPKFDQQGMIQAMMASKNPTLMRQGMDMLTKEEAPIILSDGARAITRSGKEIASNQSRKPIDGYLVPDGKGGYTADPNLFAQVKDLKATGAARTTNNVNVGGTFGKAVADAAAGNLTKQVENATAATDVMRNTNQVLSALNTGKVMAGPATKWRVMAQQVFADNPEKLVATRATIQGLAKLALGARQSLKGQGPITEGEQNLLRQAESGDIDNLTVAEIRLIVEGTQRNAKRDYELGKKASATLQEMPEFSKFSSAFTVPEMDTMVTSSPYGEPPAGAVKKVSR